MMNGYNILSVPTTLRCICSFALCILFLTGCNHTPKKDPNVLFEEDFDQLSSLDTTIWKPCTYANNAWSQHFKNVKPYEGVKIEDGYLKLKATKDSLGYKNAGIRTAYGFPAPSRLEVKARLTKRVGGGFPAIWQMPVGGKTWPQSGEIDLMEWVQGTPMKVYQTVHTFYINGPTGSAGVTDPDPDLNFNVTADHIYAADRTKDAVIFYIDGQETWRYENKHLNEDELQFPFCDFPFDIILNYSLGGILNGNPTWPGTIIDDDLPGEMWIDWVKVSRLP